MIFHSYDFVIFFSVLWSIYYFFSKPWQNLLLLVASWFFYGFVHPWFLILIVTSTVLDYSCALLLPSSSKRRQQVIMGTSIVANLGLLGVFKYFNFFQENVIAALHLFGLNVSPLALSFVLPVGISFYTFQTLSYTIDVYRGHIKPTRNPIDFALFVALFPQLVAGPIERAGNILPQFERRRQCDPQQCMDGLLLMLRGFVKKLVVADNVAIVANKVFALSGPSFPILWVGVFAFALQILADFSAYTDIARGSSRMLGIELMENFRAPYLARNPIDFWKRWHISLSQWFRDYVYLPLGGSRVSQSTMFRNVMITFILSGFWHGASWNFIIWGTYWGLLVACAHLWRIQRLPTLPSLVSVPGTFCLTLIGWLMFRESNLAMLVHSLTLDPSQASAIDYQVAFFLLLNCLFYAIPLAAFFGLSTVRIKYPTAPIPYWAKVGFSCIAVMVMVLFRSPIASDFIYFQF